MTHKIRVVRIEEYAYYVNKLRQNVGLETWIWRQIVTLQRPQTINKWPPYATEWNPPMKIFCVRHWVLSIFSDCVLFYHAFHLKSTHIYFDTYYPCISYCWARPLGKLYTLTEGQRAETFENHWFKV